MCHWLLLWLGRNWRVSRTSPALEQLKHSNSLTVTSPRKSYTWIPGSSSHAARRLPYWSTHPLPTDRLSLVSNEPSKFHGTLLFLMSQELGKTNKSILKTKTRKIGHISLASPFAFASFDYTVARGEDEVVLRIGDGEFQGFDINILNTDDGSRFVDTRYLRNFMS